MKKFLECLEFSRAKYFNHKRGDGSAYINHAIDVTCLVSKHLGALWNLDLKPVRQDILCAAMLHDVIEKKSSGFQELVKLFGHKVAGIVLELSDDPSLTEAERKQAQLNQAEDLSREAGLIRVADKICNMTDLIERPPKNKEIWTLEKKQAYFEHARAWAEKHLHIKLNEGEYRNSIYGFKAVYDRNKELGELI